jgi:hypothetical protein
VTAVSEAPEWEAACYRRMADIYDTLVQAYEGKPYDQAYCQAKAEQARRRADQIEAATP